MDRYCSSDKKYRGEIPPNIEVEPENFKIRTVRSIDYGNNELADINAI